MNEWSHILNLFFHENKLKMDWRLKFKAESSGFVGDNRVENIQDIVLSNNFMTAKKKTNNI